MPSNEPDHPDHELPPDQGSAPRPDPEAPSASGDTAKGPLPSNEPTKPNLEAPPGPRAPARLTPEAPATDGDTPKAPLPSNEPAQLPPEVLSDQGTATRPEPPAGRDAPPRAQEPNRHLHDRSPPPPSIANDLPPNEVVEPPGASPPPPAPTRLPPIPGYDIEAFVGRGGMGVVYRARHQATGRLVALKLIGPRGTGDDTARERFVREVRSLASLKHPNIVTLFDAGEWHGFPFCTMEFVPGGTLSEHLERFRADPKRGAELIAKVARGVEVLHAADLIHRDLKPLNILLGANDEPLVADFGLAKWLGDESDLTLSELPVGTRQYMAPEQTLGRRKSYTPACDVWALGVTLYEVLTGHRPFSDDGSTDVYHSIRTADPLPPSEFSVDVPAPLQAVIMMCLAKRPEDRYQTAAALADDLERWLRNEPVLAPLVPAPEPRVTEPRVEPLPAPRRRRRGIVAVSLLTLAVAIGLLSGTLLKKNAIADGLEADGEPPEAPPVKAPPLKQKSIAERLEAGETIPLTDDKGNPLFEPVNEPGHALQRDTLGDYHTFSRAGVGMASLCDQPLPYSYHVEADVGTSFHTQQATQAGLYVGRRNWPGLPFTQESLFAASIAPEFTNNERRLVSAFMLHLWRGHKLDRHLSFGRRTKLWHPDNQNAELRFARVLINVRGDSIEATVDGHEFPPLNTKKIGSELNYEINDAHQDAKLNLPKYVCEPPYLGNGIGIYCIHSHCVVRNLTVSKLAPQT